MFATLSIIEGGGVTELDLRVFCSLLLLYLPTCYFLGESVILECGFNLEQESLYSVKLYKGSKAGQRIKFLRSTISHGFYVGPGGTKNLKSD